MRNKTKIDIIAVLEGASFDWRNKGMHDQAHAADIAKVCVFELIDADKAYDEAQKNLQEARRSTGNWTVGTPSHLHPLIVALSHAAQRRATALARFDPPID